MELRVLRSFLAVAREGSVTGAANFLRVAQPTLSKRIKELEEELGTRLFVRRSHSVALTAEGMRLRKRAGEILDLVEKTEAEFNPGGEAASGEIHIGGGETRAMRLVADIIGRVRRDHPGIRFKLHSGNAVDVIERLDKGLLDFGILLQPVELEKYDYVNLPARDVWGLLMRKDSPLAKKRTIRRGDLSAVPLIVPRHGGMKNALVEWMGKDFDKLNVVAGYNLIYNASILVEQGIGCALSIGGLVNAGGLCFRLLEPRVESGLDIAWKKHQIFSSAAQVFLERVREKFA
ncbi:MAG: LysR family transcriptional regulator [Planctomycetota bacterium]|jgi:DNA-binding transcriptional LysR family regulator|nr:LysR family transcriptional regulator [Planctomycetota bacterium]